MERPTLFGHEASLRHLTGAHPERPQRMQAVEAELRRRDHCGFMPRESPRAGHNRLRLVHPEHHLGRIAAIADEGGGLIDADTVVSEGSWEAAVRACGGAVAMVDELLGAGARRGAAVHRPPGHHCETDRAMGFCLLNTVAVAAAHALEAHGLRRVMVLDWDVHHGNGTTEVFADRADVLACSLHEFPLYPGSGRHDERGEHAGEGYTVNLPMPGASGDPEWTSVVEHVALPVARAYEPQLLLVSAGFDAHVDDPLATCRMTESGFATMAGSVARLADELEVPVGLVLEGGYDLGALSRSLAGVLEVLAADAARAPDAPEPTDLSRRAAAAFADTWPALAAAG